MNPTEARHIIEQMLRATSSFEQTKLNLLVQMRDLVASLASPEAAEHDAALQRFKEFLK